MSVMGAKNKTDWQLKEFVESFSKWLSVANAMSACLVGVGLVGISAESANDILIIH